jgi:hypothetical protein
MPLSLAPDTMDLLNALAAPIDANRRPEFLSAVAHELENASAIGPGSAHRAARRIISQFWSAPPDLRQGRLGPRGPSLALKCPPGVPRGRFRGHDFRLLD